MDTSILGLATIRQNRGISLEQISEWTKISIRSLKAIECGDFSKLPGGIYNTNYLRQYARAIDFDESELLAYYNAQMGVGLPAGSSGPPPKQRDLFGGLRPASMFRS